MTNEEPSNLMIANKDIINAGAFIAGQKNKMDLMIAEIKILREQNARYRDALEWYAQQIEFYLTDPDHDLGERARAALEQK